VRSHALANTSIFYVNNSLCYSSLSHIHKTWDAAFASRQSYSGILFRLCRTCKSIYPSASAPPGTSPGVKSTVGLRCRPADLLPVVPLPVPYTKRPMSVRSRGASVCGSCSLHVNLFYCYSYQNKEEDTMFFFSFL
jgi:hypothetical protein